MPLKYSILFHVFLCCIFNILPLSADSNTPPHNFRYYSTKEGFRGDKVRAIIQTPRGEIWFGTNEGIFTYNGNLFEQFSPTDSNAHKVINGIIRVFYKDYSNNIWVGSNVGLSYFNIQKGTWHYITFPNSASPFVGSIVEDQANQIWVSTNIGIYRIENNVAVHQLTTQELPDMSSLVKSGNELYGVNHNTIYHIHTTTNKVSIVKQFNPYPNTTDNFQTTISVDGSGNIWIGKYNGIIYRFSVKNLTTELIDIKKITHNNSAIINHLLYDSLSNKIWACVDEGGIYEIDPVTLVTQPFLTNENKSLLPTFKITGLLIDAERNYWFSMEKNGIAMTNRLLNSFSLINPFPYTANSIISSIMEDSQHRLWVGTDGGGIVTYDASGKFIQHFKHDVNHPATISDDAILSIFEDSKKRIWVGSFRGGLSRYIPHSNSFKNYTADIHRPNALQRNDVRKICEDADGNLWMAVHGHGISKFNPETEIFTNYKETGSPWTYDLLIDHQGIIWTASSNGISYFDAALNRFIVVTNTQTGNDVHTLYEDSDHLLWIGTVKGLFFLNKKNKTLSQLPFESILNHVSIKNIRGIDKEYLMITTSKGLVIYNRKKENTYYYTSDSGLPSDEFIINASYIKENDFIYLGTSKGVCYFNYTTLPKTSLPYKPQLSGLLLFNKPIEQSIKLDNSIPFLKEIILPYDQNNLTFQFAYPHYIQSTHDYEFEYKMEGIDKNWIRTTQPYVQYPSLPSGHYIFYVRTISKSSSKEVSPEFILPVSIRPPFWDTWWFRIGSIISIIAIILLYFRRKTALIRQRNKELEEKIQQRTEILNLQNITLEEQRTQLVEANQTKDKLFSIIAHDLRSPFSSILGASRLMKEHLNEMDSKEIQRFSEILYQSSQQAFQLLDNLLEWARSQTNSIQYSPEYFNLYDCISETLKSFDILIQNKNIQLSYSGNKRLYVFSDKEMIKTILRNIISNSIKFTRPEKSITISFDCHENNNCIIRIQDSGAGMSAEQVDMLMHTNHPLKTTQGTQGEKGTGLGLWICKELLEHIKGTWQIESKVEKGTLFIISFPVEISYGEEAAEFKLGQNISSVKGVIHDVSQIELPVQKNKQLLIIEDTPEMMATLEFLLQPYYSVLCARTGVEGLEILQEQDIDIILSDVMMPEMDGLQFSSICKEQPETSHIPIVLLTSQKAEMDIIKGLQTGADDYLIKPVHAEILLLKINHLLNSREKLRKKFTLENKEILSEIAENSVEKQLAKKVLEVIDKNLSSESFGVEELSKEIGMHRSTLSRKIIQITGTSPQELIKSQRLKKAAQLLLASGLTVSEIAYDVGFTDPKYFSRSFKAYFGMLPTEFIQANKN
jgi:signal transduction histidine kinase/ligand-binding sensor domain-containing protein/DNA-binding response OmpR family regulator